MSTARNLVLLCLALGLCSVQIVSQTKPSEKTGPDETTNIEKVRLKLRDGSYLEVDDAWESAQGIWYRQGGLSHLTTKDRVKAIERGSQPPARAEMEPESAGMFMEMPPPITAAPQQSGVFEKPAWIYLVGGARVEADSATQSAAGVWYKRGPMSIFIDRSRIDRVELEDTVAEVSSGKKERGWSTGNQRLDGLIRQNGSKYRVDPYLIFLVMEQESHFNSRAVSPKGARGLMQLMPGTGARFGVRNPHDPAQNISGGTRYLRQLLDRFNNRVDLTLASYNAGEGAVIKFGHKVPPYRETRNYVKQISYRYKRKSTRTKKPVASVAATVGER